MFVKCDVSYTAGGEGTRIPRPTSYWLFLRLRHIDQKKNDTPFLISKVNDNVTISVAGIRLK